MKIMKNYSNNNDKLARIAMNKSLLKEFHNSQEERIVYLNDGDEFQIQLFNPYDYVIGVSFTFNSDSIDNSKLLVIKPGERVWLDRFLNENRKLLFSTYDVKNSKAAKKAIQKNGLLNIYFYKEQEYTPHIYTSQINTWKPVAPSVVPDNVWYSCCQSDSLSAATSTYNASSYITTSCADANFTNFKSSIETGRIEKGNHSAQDFGNYYGDFNSWYFKKETIKLLPQSQKQITTDDLKKKYCYNCGRKIKSNFKFCPNCGAKQ